MFLSVVWICVQAAASSVVTWKASIAQAGEMDSAVRVVTVAL